MLDFIMLFNAMLDTFSRLRLPKFRLFLQPVMTATLLTGLYAGYHVVHESSLLDGIRVAFLESNAARATRLREREDATVQAELRHLSDSNKVIDRLLESLIDQTPTVARARLDIIHNGMTGVTGMGLLRYDVTNSVAGPGHASGPLVQNRPLAEWAEFLPELLAGRCRLYTMDELRNLQFKTRLDALNVGTFLICPVTDQHSRLLGAIILFWDGGTRVPDGVELDHLMAVSRQAGLQIATVLDLREPGSR